MDAEARKESDSQISALLAQLGAPRSSVDQLRQYLPKPIGDFLANREAQSLAPVSGREIAGDVLSTGLSVLPARSLSRPDRVSVTDDVLAGRNNEPVKRFMLEQDGKKGRLSVTPEGEVRNSFLHPDLRGQGLGRAIYEAAADYYGSRGLSLRSDPRDGGIISPDAARIYEALRRRGYPVTQAPEAGGSTFTVGSRQLPPGSPATAVPTRDDIIAILKSWGLIGPTAGAAAARGSKDQ